MTKFGKNIVKRLEKFLYIFSAILITILSEIYLVFVAKYYGWWMFYNKVENKNLKKLINKNLVPFNLKLPIWTPFHRSPNRGKHIGPLACDPMLISVADINCTRDLNVLPLYLQFGASIIIHWLWSHIVSTTVVVLWVKKSESIHKKC